MNFPCRVLLLLLLPCFLFLPAESHAEHPRVITIHAKKYAFIPSEITLKKGETVTLDLISEDVAHGLSVKELGIHADMPKGRLVKITVTPDTIGDFKGQCSRFCGTGHRSMHFVVHVVE
ncbi:cupredoxin domain-containing protein [Acidipila rosea]|uniref:Cytochrome c oxidase subunit 2 n=1 Tax=Acidipila rosea TaxID=768535 RepID=A0A4R1LBV1_9BACT|nr:cupredoxin domain-containing protein [Acidipila rosea]MBW4028402.1 cytochrome c oxidase subunit II [Acidobacteriota bacterium]MBW4046022.1 cytochrome c oxidase subunit II [Acidobacteriota bacterium]TCK75037.1 cytochrome c oxidase subunit 2 [Acidipila rosea]